MHPTPDQVSESSESVSTPISLVLLAAGVGRRFGGLKQLEGVGTCGEAILEYTTFDAVRAGVGRVVLVVRPETEAEFRQTVGNRLERGATVTYVHQGLNESQQKAAVSAPRLKPWGTAHAVLCALEAVDGPCVVANADDFYGAEAVGAAVHHVKRSAEADTRAHALIGYRLRDTLPATGRVSRAVCASSNRLLTDLVEMPEVWREGDEFVALDAAGQRHRLTGDELVSMNLWAFRPGLLARLRAAFDRFLRVHGASPDAEFQLPVLIRELVRENQARVQVIAWSGPWCGLTHRDDLDAVRMHTRKMTDAGAYPRPLNVGRGAISSDGVQAIVAAFNIDDELTLLSALPGGHIHDSYVLTLQTASGPRRFVLQRINTKIFTDPDGLMDNAARVTDHLRRARSKSNPHDIDRRVLTFLPTRAGSLFHRAMDGSCWRVSRFIERSTAIEFARSPTDVERAGRAFGEFHAILADLAPRALHETIPHFHDTPRRIASLEQALAGNSHLRADAARAEIEFALSRRQLAGALIEPLGRGELPMRIAHNDAKLSNVLLDADSGDPLCVVDLDTVMPGTVLYDFGDMMRTMLCPAAEDEADLSRVRIDPALFVGLARGYLAASRDYLTKAERDRLVIAGLVITYEQGIRFLTDYLNGDAYYRTTRPGQNLDRCRAQFALLEHLERHRSEFESIIECNGPIR